MKETRSNRDKVTSNERRVEGYALVFNRESDDLGGFTEIIDSGALEGVLAKSDVLCLLNHNVNRGVLARRNREKGSLELEVDGLGLKYGFEAPATSLGDELLEGLKRGDINASSFSFSVEKDKWLRTGDGKVVRHILKFRELYDVSPVYHAAYEDTNVYIDRRGMDALVAEEKAPGKSYFEGLRQRLGLVNSE
ncbi:MAG: HK97 family phage prohead protease [Tannerella sp.]|jgi:HK97 family phage prohead protease|nr:HK97 family phage prohead protease [Tannerella sp.]